MELTSQFIEAFTDLPLGICGRHDPARIVKVVKDQESRLNILTLGTVLDINPLSEDRWVALVSLADHWLVNPSQVAYQTSQQVQTAMQEKGILVSRHIPRVWWQICRGVQGRFKGSWRGLVAANDDDTAQLGYYLHQSRTTFPVLAGPVISVRWLDLVHRIGGIDLNSWENLEVPLTKQLEKVAQQFGIYRKKAHPLVFNALLTWSTVCEKLQYDSCGLRDCPKR